MFIHHLPPKREPFASSYVYPNKSTLSEINSGSPLFYIKHKMDGTKQTVYHVNIIDILDRVFVNDATKFMSLDQERFMSRFLSACHTIQGNLDSENIYNDVDDVFKDLDQFLGNYIGVDDAKYTR